MTRAEPPNSWYRYQRLSYANQRRVWAYVTRHPQASVREMAATLGLASHSVVSYALWRLETLGYIRREGERARVVVVGLYEEREQ